MRSTRWTTLAGLSSLAILASAFVAATPAHAYPQGCWSMFQDGNGGVSYCASGSGSHRVRISCDRQYTSDVIRYGPWVGTGSYSEGFCRSYEIVRAHWVETQGD